MAVNLQISSTCKIPISKILNLSNSNVLQPAFCTCQVLGLKFVTTWNSSGARCSQAGSLTLGQHKQSNQTFELLAYDIEQVFRQVFPRSIALSFYKVLKQTVLRKVNKPNQ